MMNRSVTISIVLAVLIVLLGSTVFAYRAGWLWENAEQRKVRELQAQLVASMKEQPASRPSPQFFESLRKQVQDLPQQYQQQFFQSARQIGMREFERRIDEYLSMTPAKRRQELDQRIDEMEQMRKAAEARRRTQQPAGGTTAAAGSRQVSGPSNAERPAGDRPRGPFGGGGRGQSGFLDSTRPDFRAKMSIVMRDMEQRRKERGLPPMGPRGR
jgi:hypothetical protein